MGHSNTLQHIKYHADVDLLDAKGNLGGMGWRIILTLCIIKDFLLDPLKFLSLTIVQTIPVIGQALGVVVVALIFFIGVFIAITIFLYWRLNNVGLFLTRFKRKMMLKLFIKGLTLLGLFLDFLPFISILPFTVIYFYLNVRMENGDREDRRKEQEEHILAINQKFG